MKQIILDFLLALKVAHNHVDHVNKHFWVFKQFVYFRTHEQGLKIQL